VSRGTALIFRTVALTFVPWLLCALLAGVLAVREAGRARERRRERETGQTLQRLLQALDSASDAIGIGDMESNSLYHNRAHVELFGYTVEELNACDEPAALFADKTVARRIHEDIRAGRSWRGETEIKTKDGRSIPAFVRADIIRNERGEAIGIFGVFTDITERRAAERALAEERERSARAQRLESLGMLAGGVAHDFGNLLGIILGYSGLLKSAAGLTEKEARFAAGIEDAALRAKDLSRNLLSFARGATPELRRISLGPILEAAARGAVAGSPVELRLSVAADLAEVMADPVQMDQVFSNLAVNAVQAMGAGGMLSVTAANGPDGVRVTVADTGCGIPADVLARIWEPFFTTKAKGTGLGLATTYSVVKKHGGSADVTSEPGRGTTFTIVLPALSA
jgi:PAS domain S-box-containing protein